MPPVHPKFTDAAGVASLCSEMSDSFAIVENPPYVFPAREVYALAPPRTCLEAGLIAAVMDMDGTTTTTEVLCTGALEAMVRCFCDVEDNPDCAVLNHERDYPHIIGNSTTKHVEYLVQRYREKFTSEAVCRHFIAATAWTLENALDPARARDAANALCVQGLGAILDEPSFAQLRQQTKNDSANINALAAPLAARFLSRLHINTVDDYVRMGIEVYYRHYHESLRQIAANAFHGVSGQPHPIEPMPGIGIALALLKGWLGEEAAALGELLATHLRAQGADETEIATGCAALPRLGAYFAAQPAKVGLVTSSIAVEAAIVLGEVFRVIREEMECWPLSREKRDGLIEYFSDPDRVYDAQVTASDSSEIRLKPHRDLYSIALHTLGIAPNQFHRVAGFEDSESGVIAIRAAGISLCCAVPFAMTHGHHFEAATQICPGGMPEAILLRNLFLPREQGLTC